LDLLLSVFVLPVSVPDEKRDFEVSVSRAIKVIWKRRH
jgi:hypothetical protein